MTEEFRLTPVDIRAQEFRRSIFGYDSASVEDFRERVAGELERLLKERARLEEQLQHLHQQLKAFHERENAINDAVMMAQHLQDETESAARREADMILREARGQAEEILREARTTESDVRRDIEEAQHEFSAYLAAFRNLLDRHLAHVDALAEHERDGSPPPAG